MDCSDKIHFSFFPFTDWLVWKHHRLVCVLLWWPYDDRLTNHCWSSLRFLTLCCLCGFLHSRYVTDLYYICNSYWVFPASILHLRNQQKMLKEFCGKQQKNQWINQLIVYFAGDNRVLSFLSRFIFSCQGSKIGGNIPTIDEISNELLHAQKSGRHKEGINWIEGIIVVCGNSPSSSSVSWS